MIRCGYGSVHGGGYGETFGFTLTDNEVCFGGAEDEAGGTRSAWYGGIIFVRNAYCASCLIECLYILLTKRLNGIGRSDWYACCVLDWWRKPSGFLTPVKRVRIWKGGSRNEVEKGVDEK